MPLGRPKRLRVGLASGVDGLAPETGHGRVWASVLAALDRDPTVKLVTRGRADVWLANGHQEPVAERPLVVEVHEAAWRDPELRGLLDPGFAAQMDLATGAALAAADAVITLSEAARAQVIAGYGKRPAEVHAVHLGVDHDVFHPGISGGRERVGGPYVLFVGVAHPRKNIAAVRQAVTDLVEADFPHKLAVVTNPAPDPRGEQFIAEAIADLPGHPGRVIHFSALPEHELAALMGSADVFCLPSVFEGFGLPALEAMACGTAVVASDRGALPEVVGDAGLVVSPDPAAISEAVRRVLSDPALAALLERAASERAARFTWSRTAAGWTDVLRSVA